MPKRSESSEEGKISERLHSQHNNTNAKYYNTMFSKDSGKIYENPQRLSPRLKAFREQLKHSSTGAEQENSGNLSGNVSEDFQALEVQYRLENEINYGFRGTINVINKYQENIRNNWDKLQSNISQMKKIHILDKMFKPMIVDTCKNAYKLMQEIQNCSCELKDHSQMHKEYLPNKVMEYDAALLKFRDTIEEKLKYLKKSEEVSHKWLMRSGKDLLQGWKELQESFKGVSNEYTTQESYWLSDEPSKPNEPGIAELKQRTLQTASEKQLLNYSERKEETLEIAKNVEDMHDRVNAYINEKSASIQSTYQKLKKTEQSIEKEAATLDILQLGLILKKDEASQIEKELKREREQFGELEQKSSQRFNQWENLKEEFQDQKLAQDVSAKVLSKSRKIELKLEKVVKDLANKENERSILDKNLVTTHGGG